VDEIVATDFVAAVSRSAQDRALRPLSGVPRPAVPLYARGEDTCVVGYAFSRIDLIPDPIPVLGYLDDLIVIPLGVALAIRMIPAPLLAECRKKARQTAKERSTNRVAAVAIVAVWLSLAALAILFMTQVI
jgi:uncharacterized membrane protein YkvA (DUF1232 family)